MTNATPLLIGSLCVGLLLGGCASRGGGAGSGGDEPEYGGGIQTRAIRSAPPAKQASNLSVPLSAQNTPEAIAARERAASAPSPITPRPVAPGTSAARPTARPVPAARAAPAAVASANTSVSAEFESALAANNPHQKNPALQKGLKLNVRRDASLHARPSLSGEAVQAPGGQVVLGAQMYNADGYWWYVTAGQESGWLLQSDLLP